MDDKSTDKTDVLLRKLVRLPKKELEKEVRKKKRRKKKK